MTDDEMATMVEYAAEAARLRKEVERLRELLSDAYDSWFYGDEASYSSPPWVDRAMALLGKAR